MVSKIFHVVASDQYNEKNSSPNTLHLGPSPSIISKRQLASSTRQGSRRDQKIKRS